MSEPMMVKIIELLPNREAKVLHPHGGEEIVSLELCGCASLGDVVFIRNSFVLYKSGEKEFPSEQD